MSNAREYFDQMYRPELERDGTHFFCHACLVHRLLDERSLDERYCHECYAFLGEEARQLPPKAGRPGWIPKITEVEVADIPHHATLIKSTVKGEISEVDLIKAAPPLKATVKRGRKQRELPIELIEQLHAKDMGSKAIASRLKAEQGIKVSYKTLQRILSGERK